MEEKEVPMKKVDKPLEELNPGEYVDLLDGSPLKNEIERRRKQAEKKPVDIVLDEIKYVDNFPKEGVRFVDLAPVFADSTAFNILITQMMLLKKTSDYVISPEARGFIIGGAVASVAGSGLVIARKSGKLPGATYEIRYEKEYGEDFLYISEEKIDILQATESKVVIVDDLLATGGTAIALAKFCIEHGIVVKQFLFAAEIEALNGREEIETFIKENNLMDVRIDSFVKV